LVDIVPAVMEHLRGALYVDADPLRDRIGRFCRNTLFFWAVRSEVASAFL
jgi:hypothetical protein